MFTVRGFVYSKSVKSAGQALRGGGLLKKGELGQLADLRGGLRKKEGSGVFEGGLTPQCTLWKTVQRLYN